jgi:Tol biopolymer transport system component
VCPFGPSLAFYSDRSGMYLLWTIRPDGSDLRQLTMTRNPGAPSWSPDGRRITFGYDTWHIVASAERAPAQPEALPEPGPNERFMPLAWSPDGRRVAGPVMPTDGSIATLGVYDLAGRQFSRVVADAVKPATWFAPVWLADSRRLIVRRTDGMVVIDTNTGAVRPLITVGGQVIGKSVVPQRTELFSAGSIAGAIETVKSGQLGPC